MRASMSGDCAEIERLDSLLALSVTTAHVNFGVEDRQLDVVLVTAAATAPDAVATSHRLLEVSLLDTGCWIDRTLQVTVSPAD